MAVPRAEPLPDFSEGDTVRVHVRVVEEVASASRYSKASSLGRTALKAPKVPYVRRIGSHGIGVERTFMYQSPRVDRLEVTPRHRPPAKLYYLRKFTGRAARIKERRVVSQKAKSSKA